MQGYNDGDQDDQDKQVGQAQPAAMLQQPTAQTSFTPQTPAGQQAPPRAQVQPQAQQQFARAAPQVQPQAQTQPQAQRPFRLPPFRGGRGNALGRQPMGPPGMQGQPWMQAPWMQQARQWMQAQPWAQAMQQRMSAPNAPTQAPWAQRQQPTGPATGGLGVGGPVQNSNLAAQQNIGNAYGAQNPDLNKQALLGLLARNQRL